MHLLRRMLWPFLMVKILILCSRQKLQDFMLGFPGILTVLIALYQLFCHHQFKALNLSYYLISCLPTKDFVSLVLPHGEAGRLNLTLFHHGLL